MKFPIVKAKTRTQYKQPKKGDDRVCIYLQKKQFQVLFYFANGFKIIVDF